MKQANRFLLLLCLAAKLAGLSSCANIIPPTGGPRDSLPPKLVMALPKDSATNVNTRLITLTFDEYLTLQNTQNIIVSPYPNPQAQPQIDARLRNVTIRLKDTLEPNTTYSVDFGDAIKDVNEGNVARNFSYVFSTGKTIDDYSYSGKVLLAEKGKPDSTLIVILHRNLNDSAVFKLSPRYYTRINGKGEFTFRFLPPGRFAVYVVPADAYLKHYTDSTRPFAFRSAPVVVDANTPRDTLYAFEAAKKAAAPAQPAAATPGASVRASAPVKEDKRLRYTVQLESGTQDILSPLTIKFNRKISSFDSSRFLLTDTNFVKRGNYSFMLDSTRTQLSIEYPWPPGVPLKLVVLKDAAVDSGGTAVAKNDTLRFFTKGDADYGSVRIRFANLNLARHPVLQLFQNEKLVESVRLTGAEFQRKLFRPGAYELRILYDMNDNGIWDTGSFKGVKRQPEVVYLVPRQVAVRGNWDNEVTITL